MQQSVVLSEISKTFGNVVTVSTSHPCIHNLQFHHKWENLFQLTLSHIGKFSFKMYCLLNILSIPQSLLESLSIHSHLVW